MKFVGQTAVVTGAAVRIGKSIAIELAREGCDVVVHYGTSGQEAEATAADIRSLGRQAVPVSADLANPNAANTIFDAADSAGLKSPSILVNSAAIFDPGTLANTSSESWDQHLAINLTAPVMLMQRFAADLDDDTTGSIVNIVDWRSHVHPPGHLAYTVSKTGLLAVTRMTAQELAPRIRVNAIAPGPMLPPPGKDESYIEPVIKKLPLQRSGSPEDIAGAVVWLCDADFVTGTLIHVDGGQQFSGGKA